MLDSVDCLHPSIGESKVQNQSLGVQLSEHSAEMESLQSNVSWLEAPIVVFHRQLTTAQSAVSAAEGDGDLNRAVTDA